jgi:hypothetical protein
MRKLFTAGSLPPALARRLDNRSHMTPSRFVPWALVWLLAACAPALDWREVRPAGGDIKLLWPCKPEHQTRTVQLGPDSVRLTLHACNAAGATWALAFADIAEPAKVGPALDELLASIRRNVSGGDPQALALKVEGATPQPQSRRVRFTGRMPDGRQVSVQVAVFARGMRVYQATAMGERIEPEAAETFFGNMRPGP